MLILSETEPCDTTHPTVYSACDQAHSIRQQIAEDVYHAEGKIRLWTFDGTRMGRLHMPKSSGCCLDVR
jgi:hypothetical protein